jgi:hypothetical protein
MITPNPIARRFARAVIAVVDEPETADHNDLLAASSCFLDAASADVEGQELARRMAYAAMDLAVFYTAAEYAKLRHLALAYRKSVTK